MRRKMRKSQIITWRENPAESGIRLEHFCYKVRSDETKIREILRNCLAG